MDHVAILSDNSSYEDLFHRDNEPLDTTPVEASSCPCDGLKVTAEELIAQLDLAPHPEGGHFRETWRSPAPEGERAACTTIHYLLREGERSHWHRVDADEVWCFHAGAPLELDISPDGQTQHRHLLMPTPTGENDGPQCVIPAGHWQAARTTGAYTLVSCIVAPAFTFDGFEMAPPGWAPGSAEKT